ncbi:MAG TPA: hemerythrin domain-containing protein [Burkholderiaceae bacterium]|nr:hemerythrin domain-containing protein [Burkholderiaceae bacterium]
MSLAAMHEFEVLDRTHADMVLHLRQLEALIARLGESGADAQAREMAATVRDFFDETARRHHADEERFVFPPLLASGDADLVHQVERLQQDHGWLEEDWNELQPLLDALACGVGSLDPALLLEAVTVFSGLYLDHIALEESLIYPEARRRAEAHASNDGRRANGGA